MMIIDAINQRKSGFAFSEKSIEPDKLDVIFEAAGLAPSSMNLQPWRYIYANHDEPEFQLILDTLFDGNRKWAKDASTLVISIAQVEYTFKEKLYKNDYAWHDTGMADVLLMVQAVSLGLATHPMGGFDHQKAIQNFSLPKEYEPVAVIALGYKGDETKLPEDLLRRQNAPRKRKAITEIAFKGKFQ